MCICPHLQPYVSAQHVLIKMIIVCTEDLVLCKVESIFLIMQHMHTQRNHVFHIHINN